MPSSTPGRLVLQIERSVCEGKEALGSWENVLISLTRNSNLRSTYLSDSQEREKNQNGSHYG